MTVPSSSNEPPPKSNLIASGASQIDPVNAVLAQEEVSALAIISEIEGPSYRPIGAMMAIPSVGPCVGNLSSGCIEADIAVHAREALQTGKPKRVRYGRGSPYIDIQLPCGGGLEILVVPNPDTNVLSSLSKLHGERIECALEVSRDEGTLALCDMDLQSDAALLRVRFRPEIKFLVFGKGPEAVTFAGMVETAGYPNELWSPDTETLVAAERLGCPTQQMFQTKELPELSADPRTAIALFFHDHDWEPPILKAALDTPAFYIGAQGSKKAQAERLRTLYNLGISEESLSRLKGPIGLIPSVRDPRTLAVSVLAEILSFDREVDRRVRVPMTRAAAEK